MQLDRFQAGTVWSGSLCQDKRLFGIKVVVAERNTDEVRGEIILDFWGGRTGVLTFEGVVNQSQVSWITEKKLGDVTFPGLYVSTLEEDTLRGSWRVPRFGQQGTFQLRLESAG